MQARNAEMAALNKENTPVEWHTVPIYPARPEMLTMLYRIRASESARSGGKVHQVGLA